MAFRFSTLPPAILEECTFHVATSSGWDSSADLRSLLSVSRGLAATLSPASAPELYARIFCAYFPVTHFIAPSPALTDASLAEELIERLRLVHRIRSCRFEENTIRADMWRLQLMILESNGATIESLQRVGISSFLTTFLQTRFYPAGHGWPLADDVRSLAMWLAWYTSSAESLKSESLETREQVLTRVRPFAMACPQMASSLRAFSSLSEAGGLSDINGRSAQRLCAVTSFSQTLTLSCPDLSSAAILLTFARKNALVVHIPQHLNRGMVSQGTGPTYKDCYQFQAQSIVLLRSPSVLRNQTLVSNGRGQSLGQGECECDLRRLFIGVGHRDSEESAPERPLYLLGKLTGSWVGKILVAPPMAISSAASAAQLPDFICQRPLRCNIREYLRHDSSTEISQRADRWCLNDENALSFCQDIQRFRVVHAQDSIELHEKTSGQIQRYSLAEGGARVTRSGWPADVLIAGETDAEHDRAWGAFVYIGKVRVRDGWVVLKRQPKRPNDESQPEYGSWVFEGYVHAGSSFVGRWRPDPTLDASGNCEGIFQLKKGA
ncbi:hypothetical protein GLOTRDRAFT_129089 [Gloeophyllum trabeum ATCC 11539]|uniref:F-box domain-containing protein n=1 Tax=Gloeophyllum trabeum (strain ATCC 11539 / FP-39264 / Madison 617) TaxID=670483 RepID=S7Q8Y0_GLOTA|nr:uncharacterized protein GLOTRDRAFT_129089 [Gloeophyllum trabeum ATCC 11539]EPQ55878.1 hypothetical protein GLOTRDRAFT_129089 [Gloeophyllum trabeum ATCC 11539]